MTGEEFVCIVNGIAKELKRLGCTYEFGKWERRRIGKDGFNTLCCIDPARQSRDHAIKDAAGYIAFHGGKHIVFSALEIPGGVHKWADGPSRIPTARGINVFDPLTLQWFGRIDFLFKPKEMPAKVQAETQAQSGT
jgi:hypothetical protein